MTPKEKANNPMKQKTSLGELIEKIREIKECSDPLYSLAFVLVENEIKKLLPKEREALLNAFVAGDERGTKDIPFNAEQYFNQTYENATDD